MNDILLALGTKLIVATIGGTLTVVAASSWKKYKNWKIERKYKISGNYISIYEDEVDGEIQTVKAPLTLNQSGKKFTGRTVKDDRTWILDGDITDDGYLQGRYYAENVHDKGLGNFFLQIGVNRDMVGLWSGYDSVNKKIRAGRYELKNQLLAKISKITASKIPAAIGIAEKQLGSAYIKVEDFRDESNIVYIAEIDKTVVGFCVAKVIDKDEINKFPRGFEESIRKTLLTVEKVGILSSIAVDPRYEGRGIGSLLFRHCFDKLKDRNVNFHILTAWKSPRGINIDSLARESGFEPIKEIEHYWKADSMIHSYHCPSCGEPPCLCNAILYVART